MEVFRILLGLRLSHSGRFPQNTVDDLFGPLTLQADVRAMADGRQHERMLHATVVTRVVPTRPRQFMPPLRRGQDTWDMVSEGGEDREK